MKQILQNLSSGETSLVEVAAPLARNGTLLIRTRASLISAGTERMLVDFGRAGWIDKARQQPEKVRQVLDKVGTDGLLTTVEAIRSKLDQPLPLGYCNVGIVEQVGAGVAGVAPGVRVASNGPHAEIVSVPQHLCAPVPDNVSDAEAAFTVIGAIALQGVRLAQPTLGECFVVTGLGLIGQLAVQLLRANGCRVLGIDPDPSRTALARNFGAETVELSKGEDPLALASVFSRGRGIDGVLITASTKSSEPVSQAARMSRKRGRIVLVGVTGLELNRSDFYEKELSFQVSCSYGPGRYDAEYEERGHDYPLGFVRWTEQRNFEAVLDMLSSRRLEVEPLISRRHAFADAPAAYDLLTHDSTVLGIVLEYPNTTDIPENEKRTVRFNVAETGKPLSFPRVSFIGAGNYAGRVLMPAFKAAGVQMQAVASGSGVSGTHYGRKYGFQESTTDTIKLINAPSTDVVVVATRHDTHATLVLAALKAGKHLFVEKPLALTHTELDEIETTYRNVLLSGHAPLLMVGFNRRFAPQIQKMKTLLDGIKGPKSFIITVNAGAIPSAHWTQDPAIGGGRIIGEACHFIDLLRFLASCPISAQDRMFMDSSTADTVSLQLTFADGSIGTIHYFANGSRAFPKERLEIFCDGRVLQLDNFRKLSAFGWPGFRRMNLWRQDKGQMECVKAFVEAVKEGGPAPIPFEELMEVGRATIDLAGRG